MKSEQAPKSYNIRGNIVRGLAVLFPIYLTFIMIRFLIRTLSKPLSPSIRWIYNHSHLTELFQKSETLQGLNTSRIIEFLVIISSFILTTILLAVVGAIAQRVIGRRIVELFEKIMAKLPIIRTVYKGFRELTRIMTGQSAHAYKKVIAIQLPGQLGKILGFITGTTSPGDGEIYHTVFVPTTPNITTGYLLLLQPHEFEETNMTPEEGLKLIISAGVLPPSD